MVESMEKLDSDIMKVILRLAATNADNQKIGTLQFVAGQYLKIMSDDKRPRAFSIANLPNDKNEIELHIESSFPHPYYNRFLIEKKPMLSKYRDM